MQELFFIDIEYKGKKLNLEGWLQTWDYQHRIEIEINTVAVIFELDETFEYTISKGRQKAYQNRLSPQLLQLVAQRLTFMFYADLCKRSYLS